jgi:CubicO group peptidase (beta-lactamase class C family)
MSRLRVDQGDLTSLLRENASRHSVPGAAVGILVDGTVTSAYHGVADVTRGDPMTADTLFSVASLTKSMVATVVAGLAQAGRLSLDDPVAVHVPEVRGGGWAERSTVRDLLANRSGLPLREELEFDFAGHPDADDAALSRFASEVDSNVPPTDFWSYSNVGWCLLGRAIEKVTATTWETAMRDLLFEPAGMTGTTFATEPDRRQRVSGHEITPDGPVPVVPVAARAYGPAGTTAISTVTDLLRFAALHIEDSSLTTMRVAHADVPIHGWLDAWGLGWARFDWEGGDVWGWDGLIAGERSVLRLMPDRRSAIVLMTNAGTGRALYRSLFAELMEPLFGIRVPPLRLVASIGAAGDLSRYAGVYAWPDRRVEVAATGSGLLITDERGHEEALPIDERTFLVDAADPDNPTVTFGAFDAAGRPHVIYLMLWGLPRVG